MRLAMPGDRPTHIQTVVERRRSPRTPVTIRVEYETVDAMFSEFTRNINEGGVFIETEQPLDVDEQVQLVFRLPGSTEPIKVTGRVTWVNATDGNDTPGMGIEFGDLDDRDRERIDALVQRLRVERNL